MRRSSVLATVMVLAILLAGNAFAAKIHKAVKKGDLAAVKKLLDKDASLVNLQSKLTGRAPLGMACRKGEKEIAELLIEKGADLNAKDKLGTCPMDGAAIAGEVALIELLLAKGAELSPYAINAAAQGGSKETCAFLLEKGSDVNSKDAFGATPIFIAIERNHEDVFAFLIEKGAEVNVQADNKRTPLHVAAAEGRLEMCKVLIDKGAKLEFKEDENMVTYGMDIKEGNSGFTPLHIAAIQGDMPLVELLVEKGADVNAKSRKGMTPVSCADIKGHSGVKKYLEEHGGKE